MRVWGLGFKALGSGVVPTWERDSSYSPVSDSRLMGPGSQMILTYIKTQQEDGLVLRYA